MSGSGPRATLMLLKDFEKGGPAIETAIEALRVQLRRLPGFDDVELEPHGRSTIRASVPARNQRERDRLKALVNEKVDGWQVIEPQGYKLPTV